VRRLDAALEGWGYGKGGLKPPHSKALRAFSCFLGARQPTGMSDCSENGCAEGALECGGLTPPWKAEATAKAASSRRTPRRFAHFHAFWVPVSRRA
jgi:hypothetical protein